MSNTNTNSNNSNTNSNTSNFNNSNANSLNPTLNTNSNSHNVIGAASTASSRRGSYTRPRERRSSVTIEHVLESIASASVTNSTAPALMRRRSSVSTANDKAFETLYSNRDLVFQQNDSSKLASKNTINSNYGTTTDTNSGGVLSSNLSGKGGGDTSLNPFNFGNAGFNPPPASSSNFAAPRRRHSLMAPISNPSDNNNFGQLGVAGGVPGVGLSTSNHGKVGRSVEFNPFLLTEPTSNTGNLSNRVSATSIGIIAASTSPFNVTAASNTGLKPILKKSPSRGGNSNQNSTVINPSDDPNAIGGVRSNASLVAAANNAAPSILSMASASGASAAAPVLVAPIPSTALKEKVNSIFRRSISDPTSISYSTNAPLTESIPEREANNPMRDMNQESMVSNSSNVNANISSDTMGEEQRRKSQGQTGTGEDEMIKGEDFRIHKNFSNFFTMMDDKKDPNEDLAEKNKVLNVNLLKNSTPPVQNTIMADQQVVFLKNYNIAGNNPNNNPSNNNGAFPAISVEDLSPSGSNVFTKASSEKSSKSWTAVFSQGYFINRERCNPLTMCFANEDLEFKYHEWFANSFRKTWRLSYVTISIFLLIYSIYSILTNSVSYSTFNASSIPLLSGNLSEQIFENNSNSLTVPFALVTPTDTSNGNSNLLLYCSPSCPQNYFCGAQYSMGLEMVFTLFARLGPMLFALTAGTLMPIHFFSKHCHFITLVCMTILILFGQLLRTQVMNEMKSPPYLSTIITIVLVLGSVIFAKLRFIFTVVFCVIWLSSYIPIYVLWGIQNHYSYEVSALIFTLAICAIYCLVLSHENERTMRSVFLHENQIQHKAQKLADQLRGLKKTFGNGPLGIIDFESPLEKSLAIVRAILSDPTLSPKQVELLSMLSTLLVAKANNLLTPDLSAGATNANRFANVGIHSHGTTGHAIAINGDFIDPDQEAWLKNELNHTINTNPSSVVTSNRSHGIGNISSVGSTTIPNSMQHGASANNVNINGTMFKTSPTLNRRFITAYNQREENPVLNEYEEEEEEPSNDTSQPALSLSSLGAMSVNLGRTFSSLLHRGGGIVALKKGSPAPMSTLNNSVQLQNTSLSNNLGGQVAKSESSSNNNILNSNTSNASANSNNNNQIANPIPTSVISGAAAVTSNNTNSSALKNVINFDQDSSEVSSSGNNLTTAMPPMNSLSELGEMMPIRFNGIGSPIARNSNRYRHNHSNHQSASNVNGIGQVPLGNGTPINNNNNNETTASGASLLATSEDWNFTWNNPNSTNNPNYTSNTGYSSVGVVRSSETNSSVEGVPRLFVDLVRNFLKTNGSSFVANSVTLSKTMSSAGMSGVGLGDLSSNSGGTMGKKYWQLYLRWYDYSLDFFEKLNMRSETYLAHDYSFRARMEDPNSNAIVLFRDSSESKQQQQESLKDKHLFSTSSISGDVSGSASGVGGGNGARSKREVFIFSLKTFEWQTFNVFMLSESTNNFPLTFLSIYLFEKYGLLQAFKIPLEQFLLASFSIEAGYRRNVPYHNSEHAADVCHAVACFIDSLWWNPYIRGRENSSTTQAPFGGLANNNSHQSSQLPMAKEGEEGADPNNPLNNRPLLIDIMCLVLGSMIHDYDHPGFNNNFLVNTKSEWAVLYNDRSVLENHHVSASFQRIFSSSHNNKTNFLNCFDAPTLKLIRATVIDLVLATDLAHHFEIVNFFKGKLATSSGSVGANSNFKPDKVREDQMLLLKVMIKSADVSNASKPFPLYGTWILRILAEFYNQGDNEKALGLPVSPFMDRDNIQVSSSQRGFMDIVCRPLLETFVAYMFYTVGENGTANEDEKEKESNAGGIAASTTKPPFISGTSRRASVSNFSSAVESTHTASSPTTQFCAKHIINNLKLNRAIWDLMNGLPNLVRYDGLYGCRNNLEIMVLPNIPNGPSTNTNANFINNNNARGSASEVALKRGVSASMNANLDKGSKQQQGSAADIIRRGQQQQTPHMSHNFSGEILHHAADSSRDLVKGSAPVLETFRGVKNTSQGKLINTNNNNNGSFEKERYREKE